MHLLTLLLPLPSKSLKALMVQRASASFPWAQMSGDRGAGTVPTTASCSYQPFLLQIESALMADLKAGLLFWPISLSLHNPLGWNTLQSIMLFGERPSACAMLDNLPQLLDQLSFET